MSLVNEISFISEKYECLFANFITDLLFFYNSCFSDTHTNFLNLSPPITILKINTCGSLVLIIAMLEHNT